jgi:hypothetical protein
VIPDKSLGRWAFDFDQPIGPHQPIRRAPIGVSVVRDAESNLFDLSARALDVLELRVILVL